MKKHELLTDNQSIRISSNRTENRITFKIKSGHYLELQSKIFLASTEIKIANHRNSKNVPHLEITEVTLLTVAIGNVEEFLVHLFEMNHFFN